MARAATKSRKRPQPDARRPAKSRGRRQLSTAEQTLFFSRIRRQAKWVFVLLAVVFAGGFVFFGVGSGNNSSLGDLFNNLFQGGSGGPSISSAQKKIDKNPQNATAWHDLATAYQDKGRSNDAITALSTYTSLRPKDPKGLAELAALQRTQAQNLQNDAYYTQVAQQDAYLGALFSPAPNTPFAKAFGTDPIAQAAQATATTAANDATTKVQSAFGDSIATYQRLAKLRPRDASVQLDLAQTAELANNVPVEVSALTRAAALLPDQATQIRAKIKKLQSGQSG
jgi:tetratricopeptide (TPR) repeat protein